MKCNIPNTPRPKNLSKAYLETLAHRLANTCPNVICDIGTSSDGLVLHVTHKLDTNPVYVGKLMRVYATHYMHDLELRMPKYTHVHVPMKSGTTMLHCQHELTVLGDANYE